MVTIFLLDFDFAYFILNYQSYSLQVNVFIKNICKYPMTIIIECPWTANGIIIEVYKISKGS